jgi:hypothetical protein
MPEHTVFIAPLDGAAVPKRRETPPELWDAVLNARAVWAEERRLPSQGSSCSARTELLRALEAYVRSLDRRGRPVPYALRDERCQRRSKTDPFPTRGFHATSQHSC